MWWVAMVIIIIEKSNSVKYSLKSVEEWKCTLIYLKQKKAVKEQKGKKILYRKQIVK